MAMPTWKRTLDVVAILLTLPCALPVAVVIAIVIRSTSAGPILFQQERVGYRGRRFMCLKFRTMFCGAETATHHGHLKHLMDRDVPMVKMDARGDSRIIPFGKLIRAFTLGVDTANHKIGFVAQAPVGDGCDVEFSDIKYSTHKLNALRDGS